MRCKASCNNVVRRLRDEGLLLKIFLLFFHKSRNHVPWRARFSRGTAETFPSSTSGGFLCQMLSQYPLVEVPGVFYIFLKLHFHSARDFAMYERTDDSFK